MLRAAPGRRLRSMRTFDVVVVGGGPDRRRSGRAARFLVHRGRRVLIGCTITGSEVADFLHAATIAVVGEVPLERLRHAVPPFPTRSELWLSLLEQAGV